MNKILILFLVVVTLCSCSSTIYIVRHAEKKLQDSGSMMTNDPDLTFEGRVRAKVLADTLTGKKITAVYATNYLRTIHTADPTATLKITPVKIYTDGNKLIDSLSHKQKKGFLLVGHSNTIPGMLKHLGLHPSMDEIPENDYDNLFVVRIKWLLGRKITLTEKTYGKPSP